MMTSAAFLAVAADFLPAAWTWAAGTPPATSAAFNASAVPC